MKLGHWVGVLCLGIALVILWQFRLVLLLVFAAVVLSTALNSLARQLQRFRIGRGLAVATTLTLFVVVAILFFGLIVPPFLEQFVSLLELIPRAFDQVVSWVDLFIQRQPELFSDQLEFSFSNLSDVAQQVQPLIQNVLSNFFTFFQNSFLALGQFLLVLVLSIMLLTNPPAYRQAFLQLFPSFYRRRADNILEKCEVALCNWFAGFAMSSIFVAILSALGLWILGIRLVLAHALLAGVFNLIPNIGPSLSTIFPVTIALIDAPWKAIAVVILYIVIQNLESYLFTPAVMAKQVSLLPAVTLIAQIFFTSFFGLLGLLLALPLTVVAKVWIQEALIHDVLDQWQSSANASKGSTDPSDRSFPSLTTEEVIVAASPTTTPITSEPNPTPEP